MAALDLSTDFQRTVPGSATRSRPDVVVCGAGPGGSRAARALLDAGLTVAQFDRSAFPRVKPCAGGMTPKSLEALGASGASWFRGESDRVDFRGWGRTGLSLQHPTQVLRYVHRPHFDFELVKANQERDGFAFYSNERIESIEWNADRGFRVSTAEREVWCGQLIGADGSQGIVNRTFQISKPRGRATAVEVEVSRNDLGGTTCPPERPCFDFGYVSTGYGWVFPKRDYWTVGLYTLAEPAGGLRGSLTRYLDEKGFGAAGREALGTLRGHSYGVGAQRIRPPEAPVYLVGDAVGMAEAVTGEGIFYALESGRLAGEVAAGVAVGRCEPQEYYDRLRRGVLWDTRLSWRFSRLFYRNPEWWTGALRFPPAWRPLVQGYAEGLPLYRCLLRAGELYLRSSGRMT